MLLAGCQSSRPRVFRLSKADADSLFTTRNLPCLVTECPPYKAVTVLASSAVTRAARPTLDTDRWNACGPLIGGPQRYSSILDLGTRMPKVDQRASCQPDE